MLFNVEKIDQELERVRADIDDYTAALARGWCGDQNKISRLNEKKNFLSRCLDMVRAVDYGQSTLEPVRMPGDKQTSPEVMTIWNCVEPYLSNPSEAEVALLGNPNPGVREEPALLFLYEGEYGAVACLHGMRYQTRDTYAALAEKDHGFLGVQFLRSYLEQPVRCGFKDFVFRGAPVRVPPGLMNRVCFMNTLQSLVLEYLRKNVPVSDGFVRWSEDGVEKVFGLAAKDWWYQVEHPDIVERTLNPRSDERPG